MEYGVGILHGRKRCVHTVPECRSSKVSDNIYPCYAWDADIENLGIVTWGRDALKIGGEEVGIDP